MVRGANRSRPSKCSPQNPSAKCSLTIQTAHGEAVDNPTVLIPRTLYPGAIADKPPIADARFGPTSKWRLPTIASYDLSVCAGSISYLQDVNVETLNLFLELLFLIWLRYPSPGRCHA